MSRHVAEWPTCSKHIHCIKCGKQLDPTKVVYLEWDTHLGGPSKDPIPPERSQGCFPYGADCAKTAMED